MIKAGCEQFLPEFKRVVRQREMVIFGMPFILGLLILMQSGCANGKDAGKDDAAHDGAYEDEQGFHGPMPNDEGRKDMDEKSMDTKK